MFCIRKAKCFITILLITLLAGISSVQSFADTSAPTRPVTSPYPTGIYDWELKVIPDINASEPLALKDFQIQLSCKGDIKHQDKTNQDGYIKFYAIGTLPWDVTISKPGYLTKTYANSAVNAGSLEEPITMWAGDINQDNAINMADVIEMAKSFGMTSEDTSFNAVGDFNCDNVINMTDIVTLSKHFNKISSDYSYPVKITLRVVGNDDIGGTGGGSVIISPPSIEGESIITASWGDNIQKLSFLQGTKVTIITDTWGSVDPYYILEGSDASRDPLVLTVQGGEVITYYILADDPTCPPTHTPTHTPTPTTPPTITPSADVTPTPTSPYPTFHKFPYEVTTNMSASDITKDSAIISTDIKFSGSAYISNDTALVYWMKNNPDNRISKELTLKRDDTNSFFSGITYCTSDFQLTGLEPNTVYCCQIKSHFSPSGEIQTGKYDYYWTHGPYEPYDSIIYEFSTLP
ncbi:dockerin type I domain-containing protein [Pseudobacteroides cellulosolvens]|uniref:Dockerin domain-containing protein n=1 Tax=Pseudobacteroides cellulosolvens ATCC 35603 = DSM 2933 TaxID=398512 RepID=A0A0L6JWE8_9FIRM|nr:dockerin type I domain-containing protein [Pseudobacteroides cellulosolvens]KNY29940.1 hypothetical protein Bccel_5217 [Pseudobacteroides cellulosolvens ATCC 35603 = DSM 2933]